MTTYLDPDGCVDWLAYPCGNCGVRAGLHLPPTYRDGDRYWSDDDSQHPMTNTYVCP